MNKIFNYNSDNTPTTTYLGDTSNTSSVRIIAETDSCYIIRYSVPAYPVKKEETKKERIARVAKEKMFASWKTHQEKEEKIIKVVQVCKPRHKLSHMGRRKF